MSISHLHHSYPIHLYIRRFHTSVFSLFYFLRYHLKDVIVGKIYFLLVRIKIKHMEIAIIKRETTGSGPNTFTENETIAKYEIMDGAPVKGQSPHDRQVVRGNWNFSPNVNSVCFCCCCCR